MILDPKRLAIIFGLWLFWVAAGWCVFHSRPCLIPTETDVQVGP